MPTVPENKLPILETLISALWESCNSLLLAGDGLTDAKIAAFTNPGTVDQLRALILAFPYKEKNKPKRDFIISAIDDGLVPIFKIPRPTVTSIAAVGSGGSLANGVYPVVVTAFDRLGNESAVSAETLVTCAGGPTDSILVTIPAQAGVVKYRAYFGIAAAGAGGETRYKESGATAGISSSPVTITLTTTTIAGAVVAGTPPTTAPANSTCGYGLITDIMVETGRAAGSDNINTMMDLVDAQHPLGAAALRGWQGNMNGASFNSAGSIAP